VRELGIRATGQDHQERIHRRDAARRETHEAGDNASRELFEKILLDEEHHIDYLEAQLHMIQEIGYDNYLAQQIKNGD
jgi:bacterioferritin